MIHFEKESIIAWELPHKDLVKMNNTAHSENLASLAHAFDN